MPQPDSDAGIGCAFNHAPFAYAKKSSPGLTERSMFALRKSVFGAAGAGAGAGPLPQAENPSIKAAMATARRESRMPLRIDQLHVLARQRVDIAEQAIDVEALRRVV